MKNENFTIIEFLLVVYGLLSLMFIIITFSNSDFFPVFILYFVSLIIIGEIDTQLHKENA